MEAFWHFQIFFFCLDMVMPPGMNDELEAFLQKQAAHQHNWKIQIQIQIQLNWKKTFFEHRSYVKYNCKQIFLKYNFFYLFYHKPTIQLNKA
jgi:6-pyruvoyl-tetrahydropterin synthase